MFVREFLPLVHLLLCFLVIVPSNCRGNEKYFLKFNENKGFYAPNFLYWTNGENMLIYEY